MQPSRVVRKLCDQDLRRKGITKYMTLDGRGLGVIFDLDGVLVDSGWAHRLAWYDLAKHAGLEMSDEFFRNTFGMQNSAIIPLMKPGISKEELDYLSDWKEQRYREIVQERAEIADGAEALLRDLKQHGFRLAVGTSAPAKNLDVFWRRLSLGDYFEARVTNEDVTESKPSPQTFLKAAEKLGLKPPCCAVVEDAVQGVEAARAAGMPVVAVLTTRCREDLAQASRIVNGLSDLKAWDFLALLHGKE
jgi:HAD superfamily hydrolase (TIGR01509 family)